MRVMVIVKATKDSEAGKMPSKEMLEEMGKFNQELIKAGIMLDGAGLKASAHGARVRFAGSQRSVIDGPFTETKELVAGYWLWQVKSLAEATEWLKRCPHPHPGTDCEVEIRPLLEESDFAA
ncbi:MAG: YciI family protein [Phycisphaerales bacterium]